MANRFGRDTGDYSAQLLAEVHDYAELEGHEAFLSVAFTDLILGDLEEEGYWPDFQLTPFRSDKIEVNAWGLDSASRTLFLAITDFDNTSDAQKITKTEVEREFRRLSRFFERASDGRLEIQEHNPVIDVVETITSGEEFDALRLTLISNRLAAEYKTDTVELRGVPASRQLWDLESIRRFRRSGTDPEPIEVDFIERFGSGIPYIRAPVEGNEVDAYLMFVPGEHLAGIYLEYGPRLLERNVRSFLMARGKVNQGIRDTLRNEPRRFLAYNNGITATASEVEYFVNTDGSKEIRRLKDLQIVNGGQTTASIATAKRDPLVDLSSVFVEMKLAVVEASLIDEIVPNISRFANRQNAVQESDLAANNDFLVQLQVVSRNEWTPSVGNGRASKWYFERARGSYAVEKSEVAISKSQLTKFQSEYPPNQTFNKSDLAIYENTWSQLPHLVCRGGQKNFAEFADRLPDLPDGSDNEELRDWFRKYFRNVVAKAILFRRTDKLIHQSLGGTYKRPVVAYTVAYLLAHSTSEPDLELIWRTQSVDSSLEETLNSLASNVKNHLLESAGGRNITEWAKQSECWESMQGQAFHLPRTEPVEKKALSVRPTSTTGGDTYRRSRKESGDLTLAEAIEQEYGEAIEGTWKRFRRPKWSCVGDSGVQVQSMRDTYRVFTAPFLDTDRIPYDLYVAVDFPAREIFPLDSLPSDHQKLIQEWLDRSEGEPAQ